MEELEEDLQSLLNQAYFYLKFRPRTEQEIRNYLNKKILKRHYSTDSVEKVINKLKEQGFIDDADFTRMFVETRSKIKPKGKFVLTQELLRHGINKKVIEEYFSENEVDEESLALKTLETRWERLKNLEKRERFQKAAQFLLRRGFGYDLIKKTIEKMEE